MQYIYTELVNISLQKISHFSTFFFWSSKLFLTLEMHDGDIVSHRRSRRSQRDVYYLNMNEQKVEDINLEFFYKPHTLSLLAVILPRRDF